MTSRSTLLRNFLALLCSEFIVRGAASVGAILIARSLGPKQYGILAVALSSSFIAGYLCDLGMTHLTLQKSALPGLISASCSIPCSLPGCHSLLPLLG